MTVLLLTHRHSHYALNALHLNRNCFVLSIDIYVKLQRLAELHSYKTLPGLAT